ncbi:hypothetical protein [Nocardia xishanensis]|uniref:hypothetical protein n=1 Tax=Nocardia xishanensis TaxID=238964 RepID=UPI000AC3B4E4|nr:hypothetical protein [Nocardia xishanensis]
MISIPVLSTALGSGAYSSGVVPQVGECERAEQEHDNCAGGLDCVDQGVVAVALFTEAMDCHVAEVAVRSGDEVASQEDGGAEED